MKTSSKWNFRSIVGRMMMALVLAAMIGSIDVATALAKNGKGKHDNRRYQPSQREYHRDDRGRQYYRDDRGRQYYRDRHGKRYYHPVYRARAYAPPPVVYAPPPPSGISVFFPPLFFPVR
jgi:hypothetical protein